MKGIFSCDDLPEKIKKQTGIVNLDSKIGPGTHWVCYGQIDSNYCEYFDPFGFKMPDEVQKYLSRSGKQIYYSGDEIYTIKMKSLI